MKITKDTVVKLAYTLSVVDPDQGEVVLDEKPEENPIEFIFGYNALLPAVESHLLGAAVPLEMTLKLPPSEAFGDYKPELEIWYERSKLPQEIAVGMKFQTQGADGKVTAVVVKEIDGDKVLIDGNHPLAGFTVSFDLKVLGVRKATAEELASGQILPSRLH